MRNGRIAGVRAATAHVSCLLLVALLLFVTHCTVPVTFSLALSSFFLSRSCMKAADEGVRECSSLAQSVFLCQPLLSPFQNRFLYAITSVLSLLFIWCGICVRVQVKGHGCVCVICEYVFMRVWVNTSVHAFRGQRLVPVVSLNHFWKQDLWPNMQIISWLGWLAICLANTVYPVLGLQVSATTPSICTGTGDQTQVLMLSQHAVYLQGHLPSPECPLKRLKSTSDSYT